MGLKYFYTVHETEKGIPPMVLNPCYVIVDKDGDFVDASSAKLPPSALDHVIERVNRTHPENKPFRVVKWTGRTFVELSPVT